MRQLFTALSTASVALLLVTASSCSQTAKHSAQSGAQSVTHVSAPAGSESTQAQIVEGEPQPLGNGTVRSYVTIDAENQPQEVGVIITNEALSNLPDEDTEVVLNLPSEAAATAFDHIAFNWRPHGHIPDPIYGSPHFDIHAYILTQEERAVITAVDGDLDTAYKTPESDLIPAGYVLAPKSAEPRMGSHWIDPTTAEFQGHPHGFDHALVYGFYNGEMAFIEPMITLDFFNSHQDFEGTFAAPERSTKEGLYPTEYRISYNEGTQEHIVTLAEFIQP